MAEPKGAGKSQGSEAGGGSTPSSAPMGDDLRRQMSEAYLKYAEAFQPTRTQQRYEQAYQEYINALREAQRATIQRYSDAFGRFQQAFQETQRLVISAQQGLAQAAQGRAEGSPAAAYGQYVDGLSEAQRRQDEAYRTFSNELRQLWSDDLQQPAREAMQSYAEALQAVQTDIQRQAHEAGRAYLGSIKEFWSRLDVDAAAASLAKQAF